MDGKLTLRLVMPSLGDMELLKQDGGTIDLTPVFYGNESMGPHIQVLQGEKVIGRYRLKLKDTGKVEFKKGQE